MDYAIILMIFNFIKGGAGVNMFARQHHFQTLLLDTPRNTVRAHRFYEKAGFQKVSFKNDLLTAFQSSFILCIFYSSALYTSTSFFR